MLTLTYALVALSVEQKKVQGRLLELQQGLHKERSHGAVGGQPELESLLADFVLLDDACRSRNIELYVLPAIRTATQDADSLLADLEAMTSIGRITLRNLRAKLRNVGQRGACDFNDFLDSLDSYCQNLMKRLTTEELQILPLAQRVISNDEWFDIAAKFISHESERRGHKEFDPEAMEMLPARPSNHIYNDNRVPQVVN
jgi:hypothetical protein